MSNRNSNDILATLRLNNRVISATTGQGEVIEINDTDTDQDQDENLNQSNTNSDNEDSISVTTNTNNDSVDYDFKQNKIIRLDTNFIDDKNSCDKDDDTTDEGELCPICFEPWTNSGNHRLVCLKCGHLFGESCIDRWLKSNTKCPQCNRISKRTDIRRIYAKSIKVLDTAELDKALKDIENERVLRKKSEIYASEMKLQYQLVLDDFLRLKEEFSKFKQKCSMTGNGHAASTNTLNTDKFNTSTLYGLDKLINVTDVAGCRVVSFSQRHLALLVSQPSNSTLFPGFGIKKINFLDYKLSQYVPIHSKLIRDISVNTLHDDGIILTCGMDKMIKLTNITNNSNVHSYECPAPIWSCSYNLDNPVYFYAGMQNGQVLRFDSRKLDKYVDILNSELGNYSPVSNLQFVSRSNQYSATSTNHSGLLVSQLDKLCFYELTSNDEYKYHPLLIESNIMSFSYEPVTGHLLVSTRPSQKHSHVRNLVYELTKNVLDGENAYSLNLIQTYMGAPIQKLLARSKLFYHNQQLYGCAPDEPSKSALVWDVSRNETIAKLANTGEIYDVCPIQYNNVHYISTLTDKQLRVFKRNSD